MRTAHRFLLAWMAFLLLIQGIAGFFFLAVGLSEEMRFRLSHWVMISGAQVALIGGLLVVLSILLAAVTLRLDRREYYQVKMGLVGLAAEVDLDVIRSLTGRYWQTHFPSVTSQVDAFLRSDQTLELFVELPKVPLDEQAEILQKIEIDLSRQFARHLGYRRPFLLTAHF